MSNVTPMHPSETALANRLSGRLKRDQEANDQRRRQLVTELRQLMSQVKPKRQAADRVSQVLDFLRDEQRNHLQVVMLILGETP